MQTRAGFKRDCFPNWFAKYLEAAQDVFGRKYLKDNVKAAITKYRKFERRVDKIEEKT